MNPGGGIKLQYKPIKEDETRYNVFIKTRQEIVEKGEPLSHAFSVEVILNQRILEVPSEDLFRVLYTVEYSMMEQEGSFKELPDKGKSYVVDMKRNGEVIKSSLSLPFTQPSFPEGELYPGDTWRRVSRIEIPTDIRVLQGATEDRVQLIYEYTFSEIRSMEEYECAVIDVHSPESAIEVEPGFRAVMSGQGQVFFAHEIGKLYGFYNDLQTTITSEEVEIKSATSFEMTIYKEISPPSELA